MIQLTKEHLHDQNKKLTEENQRLELVVYGLQRQLQNLAPFIDRAKLLQDQLDQLNQELANVRRDNQHLQETIVSLQSEITQITNNTQLETTQRKEIETSKYFYEEQLNVLTKENNRLQKLIKDNNNKQISNLQLSTSKLLELGIKIDQKLSDTSHRKMLSIPNQQSPKGISKQIYHNLIQQLSNQQTNNEQTNIAPQSKIKFPNQNISSLTSFKQSKLQGVQQDYQLPSIFNQIKK